MTFLPSNFPLSDWEDEPVRAFLLTSFFCCHFIKFSSIISCFIGTRHNTYSCQMAFCKKYQSNLELFMANYKRIGMLRLSWPNFSPDFNYGFACLAWSLAWHIAVLARFLLVHFSNYNVENEYFQVMPVLIIYFSFPMLFIIWSLTGKKLKLRLSFCGPFLEKKTPLNSDMVYFQGASVFGFFFVSFTLLFRNKIIF